MRTKKNIAVYLVKTVEQAKQVGIIYLQTIHLDTVISFGLPEIDDRYHIWRLPLLHLEQAVGEVVIDAVTSLLIESKTTKKQILEDRILAESIDLVFTSPPYYNARVEYADYKVAV